MHTIKEKESLSWLTPTATDIQRTPEGIQKRIEFRESIGRKYMEGCLTEQVMNKQMFPTPAEYEDRTSVKTMALMTEKQLRKKMSNLTTKVKWETANTMDHYSETEIAKQKYPTPSVGCVEGGEQSHRVEKTQSGSYILRKKNKPDSTFGAKLSDAILWEEKQKYPTPAARDFKGSNNLETTLQKINEGKLAHMNQLPNYIMVKEHTNERYLNPYWVEALMGLPQGWTALDGSETEMQGTWDNASWEEGIPRVTKGCPNRVDRIRLCGNGVVPQTACIAWRILSGETEKQNS